MNGEYAIIDHKTRREIEKLFPNRNKIMIITIIINNIYCDTAYSVCHCSTSFTRINSFDVITTLRNRDDDDDGAYFTDEETEAQKAEVSCPQSRSC